MLSFASCHQYFQVQSAGPQHKELHSHPIKRTPGIPPRYTLIRFGRAGSLQRGPGKSGQTETAWASRPWKLGFRLLWDFRVALPWGTGRNHQRALEKGPAEENLSSHHRVPLSSQGYNASFHGNQERILAVRKHTGLAQPLEEVRNKNSRLSSFSTSSWTPVPPFALQPQFPFLCVGETSLSIYGVLKQYPGLIWALEPGVPEEPYLALRSAVPQTIIWDLSPGLALVSI